MVVAKKVSKETPINTIWDDGKYYILEHIPTGEKAYFDRTDKALRTVRRKIKHSGSVGFKKDTGQFAFLSKKSNTAYLSQVLYATYSGKPLSWVRNGRTRPKNGDHHNLTSGNLIHTHEDTTDNPNRRIWQAGDVTFLYHKKSGRTYFCRNDPELFKLLCNHRLVWSYLEERNKLQANIIRTGKAIDDLNPYFHQIVYAFEYYGARDNNFIGKIRKMQADLSKKDLTIDHLDNTQENGMSWNLSLMTISQNSSKNDMLGRIRYPFFLFAVYFDGKYRIYCGRVRGQIAEAVDFSCWICETADDLIDFVKNFLSKEWEDGLSPAKNLEENPDAVCFQNYFGDFGASGIREELMRKPEEDFSVWKASTNEAT